MFQTILLTIIAKSINIIIVISYRIFIICILQSNAISLNNNQKKYNGILNNIVSKTSQSKYMFSKIRFLVWSCLLPFDPENPL